MKARILITILHELTHLKVFDTETCLDKTFLTPET